MKVKSFSVTFIIVNVALAWTGVFGDRHTLTKDNEFPDFEEYDLEGTTPAEDILYRSDYDVAKVDCECGVKNAGIHPDFRPGYSKTPKLLSAKPLIVDGREVRRSEFPWLAAVTQYLPRKPFWKVVCGANLVNSRYLVTAAHCFGRNRYKDAMEIVLNAKEIENLRYDTEVVRKKIKNIIVHPMYNPRTHENDIALVEIKEPVDLVAQKDVIRPICLPGGGREDFSNKFGSVAGWGWRSFPKGYNSPNLLKVNLPIWKNSECLKSRLNGTGKFTDNMMCAGFLEGGKDACTNDSGSGLFVKNGRKNVLAGLVSWGVAGCGVPNAPGVYTRVSSYTSWIKDSAFQGEWCKH